MKLNKEKKQRIEDTIKQLKLKEEEICSISVGNMDKICNIANIKMLELMWYLRYER